ncbi:MAG TPA: chromate transporter [Capsulimonadaceae bacterium]|nr:chromate transporter [Capsulimonadaceae bacterium]
MALPSDPLETTPTPARLNRPAGGRSPWRLFLIWLQLGVQSFGGGVATLTLIRRAAVEQEGWISDQEFSRVWALVQLAPGINLLALTILLGRRAAGVKGIAAGLAGLLLPSGAITVLLTALYAHIQHAQWVRLALRGIIPATVGLGLVTGLQIILPIITQSRREGADSVSAALFVLAASAVASVYYHGPVVWILLAGGMVGAIASSLRASRARKTEDPAH